MIISSQRRRQATFLGTSRSIGRPCEDNLVRLPGSGFGIEDFQHPNYLVVRPHGVENNGDLEF